MIEFLYFVGFGAAVILANFARREHNLSEMRTHLIVSLLFFSLGLNQIF